MLLAKGSASQSQSQKSAVLEEATLKEYRDRSYHQVPAMRPLVGGGVIQPFAGLVLLNRECDPQNGLFQEPHPILKCLHLGILRNSGVVHDTAHCTNYDRLTL